MPAPSPRLLVLALIAALLAAAFGIFDVRERARTDRGAKAHRTDFTVYTAAAAALEAGADPYDARSPRGWRYVYPPLLAMSLGPLAHLASEDAALVWYAISVLSLGLALVLTARAIGRPTGPASVAVAFVVCILFVGQTLQRGQVTTVLLALQVGALSLLVARRDALAGVVLALGVALRLTPLLPAGVVGIACLRRLIRGEGWRAMTFPAGFVGGLVLWFAVVPACLVGPTRAFDVTKRWLEVGREVYAAEPGALADLAGDYGIEEHIFKNQGVRRVVGAFVGWGTRAPFEGDRPDLGDRWATVDRFALGIALAVGALALFVGWRSFGDPTSPATRLVYGAACLAPVLVTRYAWPVHYAVAIPFVAEAYAGVGGRRSRRAFMCFVAGVVLFALGYVGKADLLRLPARAGVLLLATALAMALALRGRRVEAPLPAPGSPS
jgi:hypothetical protein